MERPEVFVVDASVALKWYVKESVREKALQMRDDFVSGLIELEAPSLLLYEIGNALRFHPASTHARCSDAVKQLLDLGLAVHDLDSSKAATAATIAFDQKLTFYDAVYLALAKQLDATFVTADRRLIRHLSESEKHHALLLENYISPALHVNNGTDHGSES